MRGIILKLIKRFFLFAIVAINQSCILDEFKIDEIQMKESWGMDVVSPLFKGNIEFKDLINDDSKINIINGEPESFLEFPNGELVSIPSRIIFEPTSIIDSFNFMIQGNYSLNSIFFEYTVSNACPFPLNFQMKFFDKKKPTLLGPPILPLPFLTANFNGEDIVPVESTQTIILDEDQIKSFNDGNRIEFSTWFQSSEILNQQDTFLSNYPVEISIIFYGRVKRKNE